MVMAQVLSLKDVSYSRGGRVILDRINWKVKEGEHWVLLGPNGAGKTSLLRMLAAREFPTHGKVRILDEQLGKVNVAELHPRVGFCSAALEQRLDENAIVSDIVLTAAWGVMGRGNESYEEQDLARVADVLYAFGVSHLIDRKIGTLSEGERQRVLIARSLMSDPELLLLDEPAAGLDLGGREELLAALTELAAYPRSPVMVLVTHHVEEIPVGFTHAMLLKQGQVAAAGPLDTVMSSETLSHAFGYPLTVGNRNGRWWAAAGSQEQSNNGRGHS